MEDTITLFYEGGDVETIVKIAKLFNLKEFDEIPDIHTMFQIVSKTERYLSNKMRSHLKEQP